MSTCFPFASSLFYKDSVTFGTRKKKIQEWLLNDLLCSVSASVFCYIKKKKGKKQKTQKTQCAIYTKVVLNYVDLCSGGLFHFMF